MLEAMTHFAVEPFAAFFALGETPTSTDRPRLAQAYILRTSDDQLMAIHLSSLEKFWRGLTTAIGSDRLTRDRRFETRQGRIDNYEELGRELAGCFAERPLSYWAEHLGEHDVPFAPINPVDKVVEDPQVRHLGIVVPVRGAHGGAAAVRPAIQFDGERADSVRTAPLLDEHGAAIRAALAHGLDWPEEA